MPRVTQTPNPLTSSAREAAREHINGFELGVDRFNHLGGSYLRAGDPSIINEIRQARRDIRNAREELGFDAV